MRTIRIDDEVWRAIQKRAKPFEDTPNSVLRRVLKLTAVHARSTTPGQHTRRSATAAIDEAILAACKKSANKGEFKRGEMIKHLADGLFPGKTEHQRQSAISNSLKRLT